MSLLLFLWLTFLLTVPHITAAVYVPVDATVGSASVSLMLMTSGAKAYQWRIRATQIDCRATPELVGKWEHTLC